MIVIKSTKVINDTEWNSFYNFYKTSYRYKNGSDVEYILNDFLALFKRINANISVENYLIIDSSDVIGRIELNIIKVSEIVSVQIDLPYMISLAMYKRELIVFFDELKLKFRIIKIEFENAKLFRPLEKSNFKFVNTLIELKLEQKNFKRYPIYRNEEKYLFEISSTFSDSELIELSKIYNECYSEMIKNKNFDYSISEDDFIEYYNSLIQYDKKIVFSIIKNESENIIGFSSLIYSTKISSIAYHFFSGIRKEYRGKHLMMYMKSHLYSHLFESEKEIKTIMTECYTTNLPIVKTNKSLGFKECKKKYELIFRV